MEHFNGVDSEVFAENEDVDEFSKIVSNEELNYLHMNTILDYLAIDILTMYENNIKQHFIEYIERFVNVTWEKKFLIEKIRKMNITKKQKDEIIVIEKCKGQGSRLRLDP